MCRIMVDPEGLKNTIQFSATNVIVLGWIKADNSQGRSLFITREGAEMERETERSLKGKRQYHQVLGIRDIYRLGRR